VSHDASATPTALPGVATGARRKPSAEEAAMTNDATSRPATVDRTTTIIGEVLADLD
jgi:hypothetical protein